MSDSDWIYGPGKIGEPPKEWYQNRIVTISNPKWAGWYTLGGRDGNFSVTQKNKPNWIKRFCMKYFLDFHWRDEE